MKKCMCIAALLTAALIISGCPEGWLPGSGGDPDFVTISFDLNGGGDSFSDTGQRGKTITRPAEDPEHASPGFTFIDWYETKKPLYSESDIPYNFSALISGNKTLYAGWRLDEENYFGVIFWDGNDTKRAAVAKAGDKKAGRPTDSKYQSDNFVGWSESANADPETAVLFDFDTELTGNLDLYAVWEQQEEGEELFWLVTDDTGEIRLPDNQKKLAAGEDNGTGYVHIFFRPYGSGAPERLQFEIVFSIDGDPVDMMWQCAYDPNGVWARSNSEIDYIDMIHPGEVYTKICAPRRVFSGGNWSNDPTEATRLDLATMYGICIQVPFAEEGGTFTLHNFRFVD